MTPALADANNGNWQTARRWARFLASTAHVRLVHEWPDTPDAPAEDEVMLALHARRSAASIARWHALHGARGLGLVLTGTDLYRDIHTDTHARQSLEKAQALVVLQEAAPDGLPAALRARARVIFQSASRRSALPKPDKPFRVLMVGHLRSEKCPDTLFAAARLLAERRDIQIDHIGDALDPELGKAAQDTMLDTPNYRWLGGLPHGAVRRHIQGSHVLVHTSRMEGGAQVIIEAVTSGVPVLASAIDGNAGLLGRDYAGLFPLEDAHSLAVMISTLAGCLNHPEDEGNLLDRLQQQCRQRAPLFAPAREYQAVRQLVADLREAA